MLILGIVIGGYVIWMIYVRLGDELQSLGPEFRLSTGDATAVALGILPVVVICLVPLLLHLGVELYYRRGYPFRKEP
jgi:hypothetical protein